MNDTETLNDLAKKFVDEKFSDQDLFNLSDKLAAHISFIAGYLAAKADAEAEKIEGQSE